MNSQSSYLTQQSENYYILSNVNQNYLCLIGYKRDFVYFKNQNFYYSLIAFLYDFNKNKWASNEIQKFNSYVNIINSKYVHTTHGDLFLTDSQNSNMIQLSENKVQKLNKIQSTIRYNFAMIFYNFSVILIGGNSEQSFQEDANQKITLNTVEKVDIATGMAQKLPNLNIPRYDAQVQVIKGQIYVFSGFLNTETGSKYVNSIEIFNQNQWVLFNIDFNMFDYAFCLNTVIQCNDKNYLLFGCEENKNVEHEIPELNITLKSVYIGYNQVFTDSLDQSQYNFQHFQSYNNKIYMIGSGKQLSLDFYDNHFEKLDLYENSYEKGSQYNIIGSSIVYLQNLHFIQKDKKSCLIQ